MNVVVTNIATLNAGDAAILLATYDILHEAIGGDLDIVTCDEQADITARLYPELRVRPMLFNLLEREAAGPQAFRIALARLLLAMRLRRTRLGRRLMGGFAPEVRAAAERLAAADLVISSGGTYLVPHYRMLPKLVDLLVAHAAGRPYVLFTQSLGPFPPGQRGRALIRYVMRRARLILVRDSRSRRHLEALGVEARRVVQCADAAFALAPLRVGVPAPRSGGRPLRVAISVREWPYFNGAAGMDVYMEAIAALAARIVEAHKGEVTFLSTCQGVDGYWTDDAATAERIVSRLDARIRSRVRIDRAFRAPAAFVAAVRDYDAVVATRMHVAILSLIASVPVLPIAYEFKTAELFTKIGLGALVQDIEAMTPRSLCDAFEHFSAARDELAAKLPAIVAEERRSAFSAGIHVREAVAASS